ncbi:unnamed protein product [Dicrocoelium dendriticum]|nr:unnamed protein product [Dicrocoelium dendriticum]
MNLSNEPGGTEAHLLKHEYTTTPLDSPTECCAWCHKPRNQFNVELTKHMLSQATDLNPVCCSQVCFDQLRRAQFKHRTRVNALPDNQLPIVTSGRPPYFPYANTQCVNGKSATAHNAVGSPSLSTTSRLTRRRIHKIAFTTKPTQSSAMSSTQVNDMRDTGSEYNLHRMLETLVAIRTANPYLMPAWNTLLAPTLVSSDVSHDELESENSSFGPVSLNPAMCGAMANWGMPSQMTSPIGECSRFTPLPIILPIFKNAPDILRILHRFGYHSALDCRPLRPCQEAGTQTDESVTHMTIPADPAQDGVVLDLRVVKPPNSTKTQIRPRLSERSLNNRGGNCYKMIDLRTKAMNFVSLIPVAQKRKKKGRL